MRGLTLSLHDDGRGATRRRAAPTAADRLHELFEAEWERGLRENPTWASYLGDRRFDDRWPDLSPEARARSHAADRAVLEALAAIPVAELSEADRLNHELFGRTYRQEIDAHAWGLQYLPVTQRRGIQSAHQVAEVLPFATVRDYENWIARLEGVGAYVDQTIALMREGKARGLVQPCIIMERIPAQIAKQVVDDPAQSLFYAPAGAHAGCHPGRRPPAPRRRRARRRSRARWCRPTAACRSSSTASTCPPAARASASGTRRAARPGTRTASAGSRPPGSRPTRSTPSASARSSASAARCRR